MHAGHAGEPAPQTIDPDAGPPQPRHRRGRVVHVEPRGLQLLAVVLGRRTTPGDSETFTIALMVAGNGTISGTESIDVSVSVLSEMCSYSVTGTKIN